MESLKDYVPYSIFKSIKAKSKEQALDEIKIKYLEQIHKRGGGIKFLKLASEELILERITDFRILSKHLSLSQIYYLVSNYFTCRKNHYILSCEGYNIENVKEKLIQNQNDYGLPIWSDALVENPTLWNIAKENTENHYYLTYIHTNPKNIFYDPIIHDIKEYNLTGIVNFRVHLDHSIIIEVYNSFTSIKKIERSVINLKKILGIKKINFVEITQRELQIFDEAALKVTHEAREGEEAMVYLTRVNESKDTRRDKLRKDFGLENREFRLEHGSIKVSEIEYIVGLKCGKKGGIRFMRHLPPNNQIALMHKIFEILEWTS